MDNLWYKLKHLNNRKKQTLHSLGVGFAFFMILFIISKLTTISVCPVKSLFGFSCFGCGMTKGFLAILSFNFQSAFQQNVLSIPLFFSVLIYTACAIADVIFGKNYIYIIEKQLSKKYMYPLYILILIVSTIWNNLF